MQSRFGPHRKNFNDLGHAHELTFSCFHRYPFLRSERTCAWLRDAITQASQQVDFDVWAFVLMPEHVHIVVHPRRAVYDMADVRENIKEPVGRAAVRHLREHAPEWLPRISVVKRDRVRYHFWQKGGGFDRNIIEPKTLFQMIDYIHMNLVRRYR